MTTEFLEDILQLNKFNIKIIDIGFNPITSTIILHTEGSPFSQEFITVSYTKVKSEYTTELSEIRSRS